MDAGSLVDDLPRATQWCRVAEEFMSSYGCPFLYARCRTHYGGVLVAKGQWADAEQQLSTCIRADQGVSARGRCPRR